MTEILLAINTLLSAPQVNRSFVESVLGVALKESEQNLHWIYFLGKTKSPVKEVDFRQALSTTGWLLALTFDIEKSPRHTTIPLDKYGPLVSLDPNPQIPPEGTTSYVYRCNGIRVSFTSRTDRLYEIVLRRDLPPEASPDGLAPTAP